MTITILLVDDHRLVREALRDLLAKDPDLQVVGEAGDGHGAFERTASLAPDVVVLDIGLPDMNGIEVASRLRNMLGVEARIVGFSGRTDERSVAAMLHAGAGAYVTKSSTVDDLSRAIRAVADGKSYLCPIAAEALTAAVRDGVVQKEGPRLSHRERAVLQLLAEGLRSAAIAGRLRIAVGTVEVHRRNIMRKLELRTVADLTRYAMREGMISL